MSTKLAADFLDRVQRSGLVAKDRLPQLLQQLEESGVNVEDANAIAEALVSNDTLTRWQADKLLQGKHKGFFIGSYRLLKPLGRGGMGAVFLAQHEKMRRRCAVKVLPQTQIKESSSILERFYVEAQAVAALDHPNIVRAYDVNSEVKEGKDIHYLVMEYIDGVDIQNMVQAGGSLGYVQTAEFLRQTANGLAHAHEAGLVHRDIKPANLLVDAKGVVKILDLGLARFHDDSAQASLTTTHNETVLGTADYLSPEQALNSHTVDHRTDIYSLGCTGYFMLTGHPPFPEGTVAQRLVAHQVKSPKPITSERPDAPPELVSIINQMMAKNPEERYKTAAEVARALSAWLLDHGDEDWRRQHSELTGDSGLVRPAGREPTRGLSSSKSATELELAPLDDRDERRTGGSGSGLRKGAAAPREEKLLPGAGSDQVRFPRTVPKAAPEPAAATAASSSPQEQTLVAPIEELAPLAVEDLASLDVGALSGGSAGGDLLGALGDAAALGTVDAQDPLAAINSAVLGTAPRTAGTSSALRRAPAKPAETPVGAFRSVALPILIGGGGGLLLVLVIVFAFFRGSPSDSTRPPASGNPPQPVTDQRSTPPGTPATTDPAKPKEQPGATPGTSKPDLEPAKKLPDSGQPPVGLKSPPEKAQPAPDEGAKLRPPEKSPEAKLPEPAAKKPTARPADKPPEHPKLGATDASKPAGDKDAPSVKTVELSPQQTQELLAKIRQFSIDYQAPDKNRQSKMALMFRYEMEEKAGAMGVSVVETSSDAVLHVTLAGRTEGAFAYLDLSSRLECRTADGRRAVVWSKDQPGIGRFAGVKPTPAQEKTILDNMRKEVSRHFLQLVRDYRQAVEAARTKN